MQECRNAQCFVDYRNQARNFRQKMDWHCLVRDANSPKRQSRRCCRGNSFAFVGVTQDFESSTKELEIASEQYRDAYIALYNAELEYANALGLKSGKKKTPLDPGADPKFKPDEPPDPSQPSESSSQSGSDDDKLGDFWERGKDGWKRDSGGKEDR